MPCDLDTLIALCKRRGFVYPSADIYGGLNGVYDFGHLGTLLKKNIKNAWLIAMKNTDQSMLEFEGSLLGHESVWKASGHTDSFSDPMVDCLECKHRYRTDDINLQKACPHCGIKNWTESRHFNLMFKTELGAATASARHAYLRPETAQSIFSSFKNIYSTSRVKIPFGVMQMGKAFRNEITPKQFLFRMREFEQLEMEWFCKPSQAVEYFEYWLDQRLNFYKTYLGINSSCVRLRHHRADELSHYSKGTADIEYHFPFGWKELEGIANRGDYDLSQHTIYSKKDQALFNEETKESYIPHVIETSVGLDRLFLTLLFDAYYEQTIEQDKRIVLRLKPSLAPYSAAFMPLSTQHNSAFSQIVERYKGAAFNYVVDQTGSIGKRYRRQDEIGTPLCFTYDFESEATQSVTVRHRDTMAQERIGIEHIQQYIVTHLKD